jgi:5-methylcytosine-specific restriction endonuclease McrA
LVSKQDGGRDTQSNIAAACLLCNQRRHKRKDAPEPQEYKDLVQKRVSKGGWHPRPAGTYLSP